VEISNSLRGFLKGEGDLLVLGARKGGDIGGFSFLREEDSFWEEKNQIVTRLGHGKSVTITLLLLNSITLLVFSFCGENKCIREGNWSGVDAGRTTSGLHESNSV